MYSTTRYEIVCILLKQLYFPEKDLGHMVSVTGEAVFVARPEKTKDVTETIRETIRLKMRF